VPIIIVFHTEYIY